MKDLGKIMQQAQQMQAKMQEAQEKIENIEAEGVAGAGLRVRWLQYVPRPCWQGMGESASVPFGVPQALVRLPSTRSGSSPMQRRKQVTRPKRALNGRLL